LKECQEWLNARPVIRIVVYSGAGVLFGSKRMPTSQTVIYGLNGSDIYAAKADLESQWSIRFTERESSYRCGIYFKVESNLCGTVVLQRNQSIDGSFVARDRYKMFSILLFVSGTDEQVGFSDQQLPITFPQIVKLERSWNEANGHLRVERY
jgi:hypothetical protein